MVTDEPLSYVLLVCTDVTQLSIRGGGGQHYQFQIMFTFSSMQKSACFAQCRVSISALLALP